MKLKQNESLELLIQYFYRAIDEKEYEIKSRLEVLTEAPKEQLWDTLAWNQERLQSDSIQLFWLRKVELNWHRFSAVEFDEVLAERDFPQAWIEEGNSRMKVYTRYNTFLRAINDVLDEIKASLLKDRYSGSASPSFIARDANLRAACAQELAQFGFLTQLCRSVTKAWEEHEDEYTEV